MTGLAIGAGAIAGKWLAGKLLGAAWDKAAAATRHPEMLQAFERACSKTMASFPNLLSSYTMDALEKSPDPDSLDLVGRLDQWFEDASFPMPADLAQVLFESWLARKRSLKESEAAPLFSLHEESIRPVLLELTKRFWIELARLGELANPFLVRIALETARLIPEPPTVMREIGQQDLPGCIRRYATPMARNTRVCGHYRRIVGFDLDGTLIRGCRYSWESVWKYLGYPDEYRKLGRQLFGKGEITYGEWCRWCFNWFANGKKGLLRQDFKEICAPLTLTKNFRSALLRLRREGFVLALISGGIDTFIEELIPDADQLFDYICINRFRYDQEGRLVEICPTPYDFFGKIDAIDEIRQIWKTGKEQCAFVGENHNDLPVMKAVGFSIAYPPRDWGSVEEMDREISENDLSKVLDCLRDDTDQHGPCPPVIMSAMP